MPVDDSRLKGFYKLNVDERRELIGKIAKLDADTLNSLASGGGLSDQTADNMIENVIGTMSLPIGIAANFLIDDMQYVIPYVVEEASVVAAASNMAKRCHNKGGFRTDCDDSIMIAQIQILDLNDVQSAIERIEENKQFLIDKCNSLPSVIIRLGGGCKDLELRSIESDSGEMLIVHLIIDCLDAMGANAVNTMAETIAPSLEKITGGRTHLRILSNLAVYRMARAEAWFTPEELSNDGDKESGNQIIRGIIEAYEMAKYDQYRAVTHNKGIMNGISAVAVACGQDWRAVEASAHAWASMNGEYSSMTTWKIDGDGSLHGRIAIPLAVGIVGGITNVHPVAKANLEILGVSSAKELAGVMACAGLAQNLGALRALTTNGIQKGHMRLHLKNLAVALGAKADELETLENLLIESGERITSEVVERTITRIRNG